MLSCLGYVSGGLTCGRGERAVVLLLAIMHSDNQVNILHKSALIPHKTSKNFLGRGIDPTPTFRPLFQNSESATATSQAYLYLFSKLLTSDVSDSVYYIYICFKSVWSVKYKRTIFTQQWQHDTHVDLLNEVSLTRRLSKNTGAILTRLMSTEPVDSSPSQLLQSKANEISNDCH